MTQPCWHVLFLLHRRVFPSVVRRFPSCYLLVRNSCSSLSVPAVNSRSARVLFLLVAPGHLVFLYTINSLRGGHTTLTPIFITFYLFAALLQVQICLYIIFATLCRWEVEEFRNIDTCVLIDTILYKTHCSIKLNLAMLSSGHDPPLPGRLDGPLDVGSGHGPWQLFHPVPDRPGWPAGDWLPSPVLPLALVHRGQRH